MKSDVTAFGFQVVSTEPKIEPSNYKKITNQQQNEFIEIPAHSSMTFELAFIKVNLTSIFIQPLGGICTLEAHLLLTDEEMALFQSETYTKKKESPNQYMVRFAIKDVDKEQKWNRAIIKITTEETAVSLISITIRGDSKQLTREYTLQQEMSAQRKSNQARITTFMSSAEKSQRSPMKEVPQVEPFDLNKIEEHKEEPTEQDLKAALEEEANAGHSSSGPSSPKAISTSQSQRQGPMRATKRKIVVEPVPEIRKVSAPIAFTDEEHKFSVLQAAILTYRWEIETALKRFGNEGVTDEMLEKLDDACDALENFINNKKSVA